MVATRSRQTSSRSVSYIVLNKFQGGINAQRDKVQIQLGQCVMARNVEWQESGGFFVRQGVGRLTNGQGQVLNKPATAGYPLAFYHFVRDPSGTSSFTSQFFVSLSSGKVVMGHDYGTGPSPGALTWYELIRTGTTPMTTIGAASFTMWDTWLYISTGALATNALGTSMFRWNGTANVALGKAYNDDYTNPTLPAAVGNMPPARFVAAWQERMWTAVMTPDSGGILGGRIRYSHPGHPEDWATDDYIDVGQAGDVITAIVPMRDMLVIFKRNSTYALLGSGATNFRIVDISGVVGCTGQWTRDVQGAVYFWDATLGLCHFDGKAITNPFIALHEYLSARPPAITQCGGIATDGEKVYVATDFSDVYGDRVPVPGPATEGAPVLRSGLIPGSVTWADLTSGGNQWEDIKVTQWLRATESFYSMVWVFRPNAGFTSFTVSPPNPTVIPLSALGQLRSRVSATGIIDSNRRIVYGLGDPSQYLYVSDRYDDGLDHWTEFVSSVIDGFYMTPWLHGGLPAQTKRFKAPRIIQEADAIGNLFIDVYYDFNYRFLRRTLKVGNITALSEDSYSVGKPGTIGRAKAVMLVIRPEFDPVDRSPARHWGVSSITIPVYPKALR